MNIVELRDRLNEIIAEAESNVYFRDRLTVPMYVRINRGERAQGHYAPLGDADPASHGFVTSQGQQVYCMVLNIAESQILRFGSRKP